MSEITMTILSRGQEAVVAAAASISVGAADVFRATVCYCPKEDGPQAPYPWSVVAKGYPYERFTTYHGALRRVTEIATNRFNQLISDQHMVQVKKDLDQMVEEIIP